MDIKLFGFISGFKIFSRSSPGKTDDDFIDRINRSVTPVILLIFVAIVSTKQYIGQPLQCWVPKEFSGDWEKYAENYCWVANTYFVPGTGDIPDEKHHRKDAELNYYQWVPFVMAIMAIMFYLPCQLWRFLHWRVGININNCIQLANESNIQSHDSSIKTLSDYIYNGLLRLKTSKGAWKKLLCCICGNESMSCHLTFSYLFVKIVYITNLFCQFYLLNAFLNSSYTLYGWEILKDLQAGKEWPDSGHFPRVTLCDFQIRQIAEPLEYTVQCVLMINLFNEKIFIFLWFWFFLLLIATCASFFYWVFIMVNASRRKSIKRYLAINSINIENKLKLSEFVTDHLGTDGYFIIHMLADNAGEIIATDLVKQMWQDYPSYQSKRVL